MTEVTTTGAALSFYVSGGRDHPGVERNIWGAARVSGSGNFFIASASASASGFEKLAASASASASTIQKPTASASASASRF